MGPKNDKVLMAGFKQWEKKASVEFPTNPEVIGFYSIKKGEGEDAEPVFLPNSPSKLQFYNPDVISEYFDNDGKCKKPGAKDMDLMIGLEEEGMYVRQPESKYKNGFAHVVDWYKEYKKEKPPSSKLSKPQYISHRGCLKTIMNNPLGIQKRPWKVTAIMLEGTIFLSSEVKLPVELTKEEEEKKKKNLYPGFKFEQYLASDQQGEMPPDPARPLIEVEEFHCMFKAQLGNNLLIYGAEMDAVKEDDATGGTLGLPELKKAKFVELKTAKKYELPIAQRDPKKMLFWYGNQCLLAGIKDLVIGVKGVTREENIVKSIERLDLDTQDQLKSDQNSSICYLNDFLDKLKVHMDSEDMKTVTWSPAAAAASSFAAASTSAASIDVASASDASAKMNELKKATEIKVVSCHFDPETNNVLWEDITSEDTFSPEIKEAVNIVLNMVGVKLAPISVHSASVASSASASPVPKRSKKLSQKK